MDNNNNNNWIYFGVFLDQNSADKIINTFCDGIPDGWKLFCHHMTIAFNNKTSEVEKAYQLYKPHFGEKVNLTVTHVGISNDAMAVKVNFNGTTQNKFPHITIATPIKGKPVNSNFIEKWNEIKTPFVVTGTLNEFKK